MDRTSPATKREATHVAAGRERLERSRSWPGVSASLGSRDLVEAAVQDPNWQFSANLVAASAATSTALARRIQVFRELK